MKNNKSRIRILEKIYEVSENSAAMQSIRDGLVMLIPILMIGSFAVVLRSMPISWYQNFIQGFAGGIFSDIFLWLYNGTRGFMAVYLNIAISISYTEKLLPDRAFSYGSLFTSLICFCICGGFLQEGFNVEFFGAQGVFTAIICSLCASAMYCSLAQRFSGPARIYTDGADGEFNSAIGMILPCVLISLLFAFLNMIFVRTFHLTGFNMLFAQLLPRLFEGMGRSLGTVILVITMTNVLWVFGIHGDDALGSVMYQLFVPTAEINQQLIESGAQATEIYSRTFCDMFGLMGGSGSTLSLLLAVLLYSKRRSNRRLAKYSVFPMLFNVNESMVFGLPIVFNPILAIPFLVTPIVQLLIASVATQLNLVPIVVNPVQWTTPAILGGYIATGSVAGAVLQIVNIFVGVLIYRPFVKLYDAEKTRNSRKKMDTLVELLQKSEREDLPVALLTLRGSSGETAKSIAEEIRYKIARERPRLFYQPQFDHEGKCIGAEALLRWEHPEYGMIYPPLVVQLAEESGILGQLEEGVFKAVIQDMQQLLPLLGKETKISVNVTGTTIQTEAFESFLRELQQKYPDYCSRICVEITEQVTLNFDDALIERLTRIHDMGYSLAIDDFSMGSTSIKYLQTNVFDLVKLDGGLSRNVLKNPRSRDIIASIASLTNNFGIQVLAEYVETEEQKKVLENAGCCLYQGYLYSPAVPVEKFETHWLKKQNLQS